ncbi:MAG: hypothetical protein RIA65_15130 [Woeseia sp.]
MRNLTFIALWLLPALSWADDLWLSASTAQGSSNGSRFAASRTLDSFGLKGSLAGISHSRIGDSWWTLLEGGLNRRIGDSAVVSGSLFAGPGQIDGRTFTTRKLVVGGTWLIDQSWSADLSDTYINIDDTIGHVVSASVNYARPTGSSLSFNAISSLGSGLDTRQFGLRFRIAAERSWFGGVYVGETGSPATLGEFGVTTSGNVVDVSQAYVGLSVPLGSYTIMGTFDYLRLDSRNRHELTVVLKIPLGSASR